MKPTEHELRALYENATDAALAQQYGTSEETVRRWRREYGIASRPRGPRSATRAPRLSDTEFAAAVATSRSVLEVCRTTRRCETGSGHRAVQERIARLGLDTSHFKKSAIPGPKKKYPSRRQRLVASGVLGRKCSSCDLPGEWNGKPLALQVDHIDGDRTNNDLSNLRLLCPNCHSQTDTFAGRNKGRWSRGVTAP